MKALTILLLSLYAISVSFTIFLIKKGTHKQWRLYFILRMLLAAGMFSALMVFILTQ